MYNRAVDMDQKPETSLPANMPPNGVQQIPSAQHMVTTGNPFPPPNYGYNAAVTAPLPSVGTAAQNNPGTSPTSNNLDIYNLTPHVNLAFDDTFKEADSARGFAFMKTVNSAIYKYTLFGVYASFSLIIGPIFALLWALLFAFVQLVIVWIIQPSIKNFYVMFRVTSMLGEASIRLFLDPLFRSMSLMLSGIKGRIGMDPINFGITMKTGQIQDV